MKRKTKLVAYGLSTNVPKLVKKFGIKKMRREISFEATIMLRQKFWVKVALVLFLLEIAFYAVAIYLLHNILIKL